MRKKLVIIYIIVMLIFIIYGCTQIIEDALVEETEAVETEYRKIEDEESADTENAEKLVAEEEYERDEEEAHSIADGPKEQGVEKVDLISQLNIIGRTQEETNLIKEILSKHEEEFETFLMEDWEDPHIQWWVGVYGYDFTDDGEEEIIVSKYDVLVSMNVAYNYVYDREGNKLLEFVGDLTNTKIINGWNGDGTFLLYNNSTHVADRSAGREAAGGYFRNI